MDREGTGFDIVGTEHYHAKFLACDGFDDIDDIGLNSRAFKSKILARLRAE